MSFVKEGRPDPDDEEEIIQSLMDSAEEAFGREFTEDEAIVLHAFYEPVAEYFAGQQDDIASVMDSAQIDHAEGQALDFLGNLIGVERREAQAASTEVRFKRDTRPTRDYVIPSGTRVQTDSADSLKFETDDSLLIPFLDSFEDGDISEYAGDTGSFYVEDSISVVSGTGATDGDKFLRSGTAGVLINENDTIDAGSKIVYSQMLDSSSMDGGFLFGVQDADNYYRLTISRADSEVSLEVVENGTVSTTLATTSVTVDDRTQYKAEIDWQLDGSIDIEINDELVGGELATLNASESNPTFTDGGYGFQNNTGADVRWDFVGLTERSVPATATETGDETNSGIDTLTILSSAVNGVNEVTNPIPATGGLDREQDDNYRIRAKEELTTALRATLPALINRLSAIPDTRSVTVIDNDTNSTDVDGRPGHSFEAIVEAPSTAYDEIAETIINTKAAGDTSVGGYTGSGVTRTVELVNGQTKDIDFSVPTSIDIYVDAEIDVTDDYIGDNDVEDDIVQYIGGTLNSGDNVGGDLRAGDTVIYNRVLGEIINTTGVADVSSLNIGTSSSPTGTSNINIADSENAVIDSISNNITLTVNQI